MNAVIIRLACAFLFLSGAHVCWANIISPQIEQNGKMLDADSYFTSPSDLTIYLTNELIRGEWKVEILTTKDTYQSFSCWRALTGKCIISPREYGFDNWYDAKRIYNETLNRDFFQLRVSYTPEYGEREVVYVKLGLLPSRPVISNVAFTYTYDWKYDMIFPYGNFSFDVYSESAKIFHMHVSENSLFEQPDFFLFGVIYYSSDFLRINYEDADWGEYIYLSAGNDFGYVLSDVICTTSYITDEDILNRIDELRENAGVEDVATDVNAPSFRWDNSVLTFNTQIDQIYAYNLNGILLSSACGCDTLDLSNLPKGIYIIVYQYKSQLFKTKISKL